MNNPYQECISAMDEQWRGERPTSGFCIQIAAMPKKVIFNNPATIVYWLDGSKTVVKCGPDDEFDPEKGLAMAICKYAFGNDNAFHKVFKKWLPKEEEINIDLNLKDVANTFSNLADAFKKLFAPVPDEDI